MNCFIFLDRGESSAYACASTESEVVSSLSHHHHADETEESPPLSLMSIDNISRAEEPTDLAESLDDNSDENKQKKKLGKESSKDRGI